MDPVPHWEKQLDPDPQKMNSDQHNWYRFNIINELLTVFFSWNEQTKVFYTERFGLVFLFAFLFSDEDHNKFGNNPGKIFKKTKTYFL